MPETTTLCPYCGVGCGLRVTVNAGRIGAVSGDPDHPVNRGRACAKPRELASAVHATDRLGTVLARSGPAGGLVATGWDAALAEIAGRLRAIRERHGPDAIGFYISGQLLTEDYYAVNKLAKGFLGTNHVDANSRLCMSSAVAGYTGAFGADGPPGAYADIELADCLLLLGSNAAACHPILFSRILARQREGATVICIDPRRTATADAADLHLQLRPGTDLALLNGMLAALEAEGLLDEGFLSAHVRDFEAVLATARECPPECAAKVTGVPAALIREAAARFGSAGAAMALWSMGANQSTVGTLKNRALINLCLATGNLGRPGSGPFSLTGQPNAMGGREVGGLAHLLPGYRRVDDATHRAEVAAAWGVAELNPAPGLPAVELFGAAAAGRVKALWIIGTNPVVSMPHTAVVREALRRCELVVVQDAHHPTETSALADFVLPAAAWPEKEGTMTNSERRVDLVRRLLAPPGEARADWEIIAALAAHLGHGSAFGWRDAAEVYDEFAQLTRGRPCDVSGITHARLARSGQGIQWPCPAPGHPGTARLYGGGTVATADGRSLAVATPHSAGEGPSQRFPLLLSTGRIADQWHTMTRTGKSARLRAAAGEPVLEIHPTDASAHGINDGALVLVRSVHGEVRLRARVCDTIGPGVVFAPFHWGALHAPAGAGALNGLTGDRVDPVSQQPELKLCPVSVAPTSADRPVRSTDTHTVARLTRELVIVGGGMAGMAVAAEVTRRRSNTEWRVTVLAAEAGLPYNRVQVSRLLEGTVTEASMSLLPADWFAAHHVNLRAGVRCVGLDLAGRIVEDDSGGRHRYDALVLATGSRPFLPPVPGIEHRHVHPFRTIADATALQAAVRAGARTAVVIGGGLLGLEAAAGLLGHGAAVTVVERGHRLMPQQLDAGAAELLARRLSALGIDVRIDCAVTGIDRSQVRLDDGTDLPADVVVVAAGVVAETELARTSGIACARGVQVDDELRTSAPSVWAVGECAEHAGQVYGLWAPLAAQARTAAAVIVGDPHAWTGARTATTLKVAGIDLFAGGEVEAGRDHDQVVDANTRTGRYRRLLLERDRLIGAIVLGSVPDARALSDLLSSGDPVPAHLLDGNARADGAHPEAIDPDPDPLVCTCNAVRRSALNAAIGAGAGSIAALGRETGAGSGCGSCRPELAALISSARNISDPLGKPLTGTMRS
ncbi:nitrate reductase [Conexibacter sp. DBS9H8]|uniref:nitrate reductase n=1 Tax=Conexibacter sp. DBS9H8 TaxID=2937801 RepID=UPI00200F1048|nr:nitrate reductase [Conexibacter sp. DBS9H8]